MRKRERKRRRQNALVGPLIAVASFVCSCGTIPLASVLWTNGISFGGVISFIYGDLIVIPLIMIYAYCGVRAAAYITAIVYASMVVAVVIVVGATGGKHLLLLQWTC